MEIHVTLHGILRDTLPRAAKGKTSLTLSAGAAVDTAVQQLQIRQSVTAAINGRQVGLDHPLAEGDHLHLFRMIGGG